MSNALTKGIYESNNDNLVYSGTWSSVNDTTMTSKKDDYLELKFKGTGINIVTISNNYYQYIKIYLDDLDPIIIKLFSDKEIKKLLLYSTNNLEYKEHNIKLQNIAEGNVNGIEYKMVIKEIEVLSSVTEVPVESIETNLESIILNKGGKYQIKYDILPEDATNKSVKFESGNTGFVTVTETGLLNYVYEGETNVSITSYNGISKSINVICKPEDILDYSSAEISSNLINEGILIANESEVLEVGDKIKIIANLLPYNLYGSSPYILKSSDENVIRLLGGQVIEAVGEGDALITAYTEDLLYKDSIEYTVKKSSEQSILDSEIYNLDLNRFNIVVDSKDEKVSINNSLGINAAIKFCSRYNYKKLLFPNEVIIYIEPKISIYMTSDVIVDLNNSELKLRPNDYESYSAIIFKEGNINLFNSFNLTSKEVGTFISKKNVAKTVLTTASSFSSNSISVRNEKSESEANQDLKYLLWGSSIDYSLQIARKIVQVDTSKIATVTAEFYVDYYKDTLIASEKIKDISLSSTTAQYFSTTNGSFALRKSSDYDFIKVRLEWKLTNATAEIYIGDISICKKVQAVLNNSKLCNGIITGEKDTKEGIYPNWKNISSTESGCSIIFYEGSNNGIENLNVRKSIGFNISSGLAKDSYGVVNYSKNPISYGIMESGSLDEKGENIECNTLIRTNNYIDISNITTSYYEIGYPLGYQGYPYVSSRIYDICFYDANKKFIRKDRGLLRFRRYTKPDNAYYVKVIFYSSTVPTSGNTDFGGAFAFIENFAYPMKNYIKNCIIEDNYSCGFAACGGQKWKIKNNTWRNNKGRMPGCDIDWEDGWEYMQGDIIEENSFESNNNCILCAGSGNVYFNNKFNGVCTFYGRSQYYSIIFNTIEDIVGITNGVGAKLDLASSTDIYLENNIYNKSSIVWKSNSDPGIANYDLKIESEKFNNSNILSGNIRNIRNCYFTGSDFLLYCVNVIDCLLENGIVLTNSTFNNCYINSMIIRATSNSQVNFSKSSLLDCTIEVMYQCKDFLINNCLVTRGKVGQLMSVTGNSTGGLVVNDTNLVFEKNDNYHYIIGGWNASGCSAVYTFNNCKMTLYDGFKGYLIKCSWYADATATTHVTLNFNNTDVSKFEKTDAKGLKSNIVFNIK